MDPARLNAQPSTSVEHRRQARRIRALHRNDPVKTQQALRTLIAGRAPRTRLLPSAPAKFDWSDSAILGHRTPQARTFADEVAMQLLAGVLPFSNRQTLLAQAANLGITRFEASLIIAAVQHRMKQPAFAPPAMTTGKSPRPNFRLPWQVMVGFAAELFILIALARLFV